MIRAPFPSQGYVLAPVSILLVTALAVVAGPSLPPSLAGLTILGPYAALFAAGALALWFNHARTFIVAVSMLLACAGYRYALDLGGHSPNIVYTALVVLVPANALAALLASQRGVSNRYNYRWLLLGAAELLFVLWIADAGRERLSGAAWADVLGHWALRSPPTPLVGRLLFAAAFAAAVWRAWPKLPLAQPRSLDAGIAGALAAFFIAAEWAGSPAAFAAFMAAAGLILLVAVLQESRRLAFADELTGLPSRRALHKRLHALKPACAIAMVDVDHFKEFNDTHGHDIGDQMLKLVAAHLAAIEGGGEAFRYGGEEFCVIFDGCSVNEALPHLENLRAAIRAYRMAVRGDERPALAEAGSRLRSSAVPRTVLSVTVSIGVAGREDADTKATAVLKAADAALYRAKHAGRDRVARW